MHEKQLRELLKKYHEGSCTPEERRMLDDWYRTVSVGKKPFADFVSERAAEDKLWSRISSHMESDDHQGVHSGSTFRHWRVLGIAASVIFLIGAVFLIQRGGAFDSILDNSQKISGAERRVVNNDTYKPMPLTLPDGTKIELLPGSSVSFSDEFTAREREVSLEGEAFFDVVRDPDRPFIVLTSKLTTRVVGTSFLVRAYKGQKEAVVIVKTGKVAVSAHTQLEGDVATREEIILTPNQKVVYNSEEDRTQKSIVDKPEIILPKPTLQYSHTNSSVAKIIRSLEENYGIDIIYDSLALSRCTITSDMSGAGFMEQIEIICSALGAEYKISETSVAIKSVTACVDN